jgi:hypothetical protein
VGVGGGIYPNWVCKENLVGEPATLEIEGDLIGDADTDTDGLPDDWETLVFGNLTALGVDDFDRDGLSNRSEFLAGTDPKSAALALRILDAQSGPGLTTRLRFVFAPSRYYRVESSTVLGNWQPAAGLVVFSPDGEATWTGVQPATDEIQFYRVIVTE